MATAPIGSAPLTSDAKKNQSLPQPNDRLHSSLENLRTKITKQEVLVKQLEPKIFQLALEILPSYIQAFGFNVAYPIKVLSVSPQNADSIFSNRVDVMFNDHQQKLFALDIQLAHPCSSDTSLSLDIFKWIEASEEYQKLQERSPTSKPANDHEQKIVSQTNACCCTVM